MNNYNPSSSYSSFQKTASTPLFHNDINKAYDEEWQKLLERSKDVHTLKMLPFLLNLSTSFDTISKLCKEMDISIETEFIALDCLESMLESFLHDLTKAINEESNGDSETINTYWSDSHKVFEKDVPLIIFLIVSIAAKYTDANAQFDHHKVRELVQKVTGEEIELSDIREHEYNLFKTMDFKVASPVALHSMQQLMKLIYDKSFVKVELANFLKVGVLALRYSYLNKHEIYESFAKGIKNQMKFKKFTQDKVLLAAAVVYASKSKLDS